VRRTYKVRHNDEGKAQRRRWTFYEAINFYALKSSKLRGTAKPV
jgi:hypothetical protein